MIKRNATRVFTGFMGFWSSLGFYRGARHCMVNYYDEESFKQPLLYSKTAEKEIKKILYTGLYGIAGVLIYANPLFFPHNILKEVYRLEVCIRGLEDEKKSKRYTDIL